MVKYKDLKKGDTFTKQDEEGKEITYEVLRVTNGIVFTIEINS